MRTTLKNIKIDTLHIFVVFFAGKGKKFAREKSGKFSNTAENTFSSSSASRLVRPGIRCYRCVHILGRLRVERRIFTSSLASPPHHHRCRLFGISRLSTQKEEKV
jgi:hypothetical protein